MAKQKYTETQIKAVEFISGGYTAGTISANMAFALLRDAGLTLSQRISELETMCFKKGLDQKVKANV